MTTAHLLAPRRTALPSTLRGWSDFDRLFDGLCNGLAPVAQDAAWRPRVDVTETEAEYRVAAELPGLDEKDIDISLEDGLLTISGERVTEDEGTDASGARHVETWRGKFRRALRLPVEVDAGAVKAVYRSGILTVTLPKAAQARPRNIPVTS